MAMRHRQSTLALFQIADHRCIEPALHEADHALDLIDRHLEALREALVRRRDERGARAVVPARGGGAVDTVGSAELVDREALDDLLLEERAVLGGEVRDREAEGLGELGAVLGLELFEEGIAVRAADRFFEGALDGELARLLLLVADELARGGDADPAAEWTLAAI